MLGANCITELPNVEGMTFKEACHVLENNGYSARLTTLNGVGNVIMLNKVHRRANLSVQCSFKVYFDENNSGLHPRDWWSLLLRDDQSRVIKIEYIG
jgi:hypothetical protein